MATPFAARLAVAHLLVGILDLITPADLVGQRYEVDSPAVDLGRCGRRRAARSPQGHSATTS